MALKPEIVTAVKAVAKASKADVFLYSGGIYEPGDDDLRAKIAAIAKRQANAVLMLTTDGGNPDVAFRIVSAIRDFYPGRFTLLVNGRCKSAGTLIAVGAYEIVVPDGSELGPLDMQLRIRDEVGELGSGLTPVQALTTLRSESFRVFDEMFKRLRYTSHLRFPTRIAAMVAAKISIGVLRPIYQQIDPMRLGETQRAMTIGAEYGTRLDAGNVREHAIVRLVAGYPSHSFVINRREAMKLFHRVRPPTAAERLLMATCVSLVAEGQESDEKAGPPTIEILSGKIVKKADPQPGGGKNDQVAARNRTRTRPKQPARNRTARSGRAAVGNGQSANGSAVRKIAR